MHVEFQTQEHDQVGFLDAIAKRVTAETGGYLGEGIRNSAFFARHQHNTSFLKKKFLKGWFRQSTP